MKLRSATSMTPFSIHCSMWKAGGDRPSRPFVAELCDGSGKEVAILKGICEIADSVGCSKLPLWQPAKVQAFFSINRISAYTYTNGYEQWSWPLDPRGW